MSRDNQKCENCLHYRACLINSEYVPSPCSMFEDKAGYRKASEVAREIFEEIEKITMHNVTSSHGIWLMSMGEVAFAELKKKYTGKTTEGEG